MAVTEIANKLGEWSVTLKNSTPLEILNKIDYFGHIVITSARVDPDNYGDNLFDDGRYVGVVRGRSFGEANKKISGPSQAFWLGDEDAKGEVIESPITFVNASFTDVITALLPDALQAGTIVNQSGLYNGIQVFQSPRQALDYIFGFYNAEWKITGKGKFHAGAISDLYVTTPKTAILRSRSGLEMDYRALPGSAKLDADVKDFTTRVLLLAEDADRTTVSATADINPTLNPYLDLFGNPVKLTRIVVEQATAEGNATARAQLQLNRFTSPRDALTLSTTQYDIKGSVEAGDYVWVYDPDAKLTDPANEISFDGEYITPLKLRVFQTSWPIVSGMGVAYRDKAGVWYDLTDYVQFEAGSTSVVVGGYNRSLTGQGSITQDPGSGPTGNSTIPKAPDFILPFKTGTYQSDVDGLTRADVIVAWTQPLNTDNSVITDGGYYEVRYRTGATAIYPATHFDMSFFKHNQLTGPQSSPIPADEGPWNFIRVPWGTEEFRIMELTPGIPYDIQIRAFDNAVPVNFSDWSALEIVQTRPDTTAPSTPANPVVAASKVAVQIIHNLGKASGGTFNLEADLNHLQIHAAHEPTYTPVDASLPNGGTLLGKLVANIGMMRGEIPAVGTFPVPTADQAWYIKVVAVDNFGNPSGPSNAVQQTAELWDDAYISNLSVSKVIAGTVNATWIQGGDFTTGITGIRAGFNSNGFYAFNNTFQTFRVDSATGDAELIGTVTAQDPTDPDVRISMEPNHAFPNGITRTGLLFYTEDGTVGAAGMTGIAEGNRSEVTIQSGPDQVGASYNQAVGHFRAFQARIGMTKQNLLETGGEAWFNMTSANVGFYNTSSQLRAKLYLDQDLVSLTQWDTSGSIRGDVYARQGEAGIIARNSGGTGRSWGMAIGDAFQIGTAGVTAAESTTGTGGFYFTAIRYCSSGEGAFAGQKVGSGVAGQTFSIGDGGGADPALFCDGYAGRFVKNFVIDHPTDPDKWLAHATTETPVPGLEYSGEVEIRDYRADVQLPSYFEAIAHEDDRQVFVDVQLPLNGSMYPYIPRAIASTPEHGRFWISSDGRDGTRIVWRVYAKRKDVTFEVEPLKSKFDRGGEPPYTYLVEK